MRSRSAREPGGWWERTACILRALRVRLSCYVALATARRDSLRRLGAAAASSVLIVCYGNIYRSPLAAEFFRRRPVRGLSVRSVGVHPVAGRASPERHVQMCKQLGFDLHDHRSAVLSRDDLCWADLVVLMDRHNWQTLTEHGVDPNRLVWLGAMDDGPVEIPDPYGQDDESARRIVNRLIDCCEILRTRLAAQAADRNMRP